MHLGAWWAKIFTDFNTWNPISNSSPTSWGPSQSKLVMSQWIYNLTMSVEFKWIAYALEQLWFIIHCRSVFDVYIVRWWGFSNVAVESFKRWLKLQMYGPASHLLPMHCNVGDKSNEGLQTSTKALWGLFSHNIHLVVNGEDQAGIVSHLPEIANLSGSEQKTPSQICRCSHLR